MREIERETLAEQIAAWLADRIVTEEFQPGQAIIEAELAERLQVSRSPIREAIRMLAGEGLVTVTPRRGVVVSLLSARDGGNLYECRAMLEGPCARLAASVLSDDGLARLRGIFKGMETAFRAGDVQEYQRLNAEFHLTLYSYCPNKIVVGLIQQLWRKRLRYRGLLTLDISRIERSLNAHDAVVRALERRELDEVEEMIRGIILSARKDLVEILNRREAAGRPGAAGVVVKSGG
jgi:DNA-binding GntR family transcriptional regulator